MIINKRFTLLFLSSVISILGGSLSYIAIYWTFSTSSSLTMLAVLSTCYFLARFVFFLTLSPFVDRYDSNLLMKVTMVARGVLLIIFAGLLLLFSIELTWILVMVVLQTALEALFYPSSTKIIVKIVEEEDQSRANAYLNLIERTGVLVGMALGGLVVTFYPLHMILAVEGIGYLLGALLMSWLTFAPEERNVVKGSLNFFQEWKEGLLFIVAHKWMIGVMGLAVLANLAVAPQITLLAPYASEVLQGDSFVFSLLEIAGIVGGIASGVLLSRIKVKNLAVTFSLACILEAVLMFLFGLNRFVVPACIILAGIGFAITLFNIPFSTILQKYVPEHLLGRVRASLVAISTGVSSFGYFMTGVVSNKIGVSEAIICFSLVSLAGIFILLLLRPFKTMSSNGQTPAV